MLDYRLQGRGAGVLLLHPVGLDLTWWDDVVAHLAPRYSVLRVSAPGHGGSEPIGGRLDLDAYVAAVADLMTQALPEPAAAVGVSYGGIVAQLLALAAPKRIGSLCLAATGGGIPSEAAPMLRARGTAALEGGMGAVCEDTLERWRGAVDRPDMTARTRRALMRMAPRDWAETWNAIADFDARDRLHEIAVPTLVVHGEADRSSPLPVAQALAGAIPGARLEQISGAGHLAVFEEVEAFVALLDAHLER